MIQRKIYCGNNYIHIYIIIGDNVIIEDNWKLISYLKENYDNRFIKKVLTYSYNIKLMLYCTLYIVKDFSNLIDWN